MEYPLEEGVQRLGRESRPPTGTVVLDPSVLVCEGGWNDKYQWSLPIL